MKIKELLTENKKGVKSPIKPRNFVAKNAVKTTSGAGAHTDKKKAQKQGYEKHKGKEVAESSLNEFAPDGSSGKGGGKTPRNPGRDPWGNNDGPGEDPYKYPQPEHYSQSIDFFGRFEADHFDKEEFDETTGVFKGYWDYNGKLKQIAYFKFDNPQRNGDDDPGMGWYYEPDEESMAEGMIGLSDKEKGKIQNIASEISDIPGYYDFRRDRFTPYGVLELQKALDDNDEYVKYALSLTSDDYELESLAEEKQKGVDGKACWKGYKRMGTKMKGDERVDNCVPMKKKKKKK